MIKSIICAAVFLTSNLAVAQNSKLSCETLEGNLRMMGDKCLAVSSQAQRDNCFKEIEKGIAEGYKQQCGPVIAKFKTETQAKAKAKFPAPAVAAPAAAAPAAATKSATPGAPAAEAKAAAPDCSKLVSMVTAEASKCLSKAGLPARKKCFDDVGTKISKDPSRESCQAPLDSLKNSVREQERSKYPKQNSALEP